MIFVDEPNADFVHVFEDTLEVHITAIVKEDFVDTCAGAVSDLNGMLNLETSIIQ